jgi:3-hydroxyacyl-CoA dehydrogenase/enoyl-CoA hydratase/3-hydroxybutyryl-CoA epimerase/enoyl-CoA isomerase
MPQLFGRAEALKVEHQGFLRLAKTEVAANLVQMFLNDQHLSNSASSYVKSAGEVKSAGVLGAGIMGGGIAYQSALKGTPILMKDIAQEGLDLGMMEASKLLNKQLARGRIDSPKLMSIMSSITPSLSYDGFEHADIVVEAIVENLEIKKIGLGGVGNRG